MQAKGNEGGFDDEKQSKLYSGDNSPDGGSAVIRYRTGVGGIGDDLIYGGGGLDSLAGSGGDDVVYGGGGNDLLLGGEGDDLLYGLAGDDSFVCGDGPDLAGGGPGTDVADVTCEIQVGIP